MDETLAKIKAHGLHIIGWTLIEGQQLIKLNVGTNVEPQMVKINGTARNKQNVRIGATIGGIQRCFYMDI